MNAIGRRKKTWLLAAVATASTLATCLAHISRADFLSVYGGPTYSPSAGGYIAEDPLGDGRFLLSAHVNDAGVAAATTYKVDVSRTPTAIRAITWSASSILRELGGNPDSWANRINAGGTIAGEAWIWDERYVGIDFDGWQRSPVQWAPGSAAPTVLDHPYDVVDTLAGRAADINDAGAAVGAVHLTSLDPLFLVRIDKGYWPARWDASGTALTKLGLLTPNVEGFNAGAANAINSAGVAVGNSGKSDGAGNPVGFRAVRWNAGDTTAIELGNLGLRKNPGQYGDGWTESNATAVNSAGTAVGYCNVYDDAGQLLRQHAPVRWDASGEAVELSDLPGSGAENFAVVAPFPTALNDAGTAVGWSGGRAVRWNGSGTAATELGNLGTSSSGLSRSEAWAINNAGTAVGSAVKFDAAGAELGARAVYWGTDNLAIDLNALIDLNSGWLLTRALEISDTGWIVGTGRFDPDGPGGTAPYERHFLMQVPASIPEPSALTIALTGALVIGRRQVRRLNKSGR